MKVRAFFLALLCAFSVVGSAQADPGANQLTSWGSLCAKAGTSGTTFIWKTSAPASCTSTPNRIITWSDFTTNVNSSGCASGNPLPTWSALLGCKTGASATLTSQAWNGTGALYTTDGTSCFNGGGSTTLSFTTPAATKAPTSSATQITLAFSSVAQWTADATPTTGTGISYQLTAPGGGVVASGSITNGSAPSPFYWNATAPAGAYVWQITGLGAETCTGLNLKTVHNNTAEQFNSTVSWYQ